MKVSIVVTAYLDKSKPYLDECIRSIDALEFPREMLEVIVVGRAGYTPEYPNVRTIAPPEPSFYNARGINYGVEHSSGEYLFILNDDVILTRLSLLNLLGHMTRHQELGLVMPIGNDQQMRYHIPLSVMGPYRLENVSRENRSAMTLAHSPHRAALMFHNTLCLYAALMRRELFAKVGPFDDSRQGQDDIDYSLRVRQAGYLNAIATDAIVWHAGGVSADLTMNAISREESLRSFNEKWGGV